MKPYTVHQIHIDGRDRNSAQHLDDLKRDVLRQQVKAWKESGQPLPDAVRETAVKMGIEVEQ